MSRQQGKGTRQTRNSRAARDFTLGNDPPEDESDSDKVYKLEESQSDIETFSYSDPQSGPAFISPGSTPVSNKSTPQKDDPSLYPDARGRPDLHYSPRSGRSSRSSSSHSSPGSHTKSPNISNIYPDLSYLSHRKHDDSSGSHDFHYESYTEDSHTSSSHQDKSNQHDKFVNDETETNHVLVYIFGGIFIIVAIVVVLWSNMPSSSDPKQYKAETEQINRYEFFSTKIKELQQHFPNQKDRLWRSVIASSRHVLKEPNSTYPSVILLASQVKSPRLSFCIAEKIASHFIRSHGIEPGKVPTTDIEAIMHFKASEQKLKLDENIQVALQKPDGKAYIIQNLQTLSPQAALLLHGLCDGDNAPYKDVMILMTLEIDDISTAMTADQIENYLAQMWTTPQVEYDKVSAVMSRIANNLVILQQENPSDVERVCSSY